jgi:glutathione S-transferase
MPETISPGATMKFRIDTMYGFMEQELGEQPYANGEEFSLSDCAALPGPNRRFVG